MGFNLKIGEGLLNSVSKELKNLNRIDVRLVPPDQITESTHNAALSMDGIGELQRSIEDVGLKQLPTLTPAGENQYRIIAGHRRIRAIKQSIAAGNSRYADGIPCLIEDFTAIDLPVSDQVKELYVWATTNTESRELTIPDKLALKQVMDAVYEALEQAGQRPAGTRRAFVAEKMKVSETQAQRLDFIDRRLLQGFKDVLDEIPLTVAEEIAKFPTEEQALLYDRFSPRELTLSAIRDFREDLHPAEPKEKSCPDGQDEERPPRPLASRLSAESVPCPSGHGQRDTENASLQMAESTGYERLTHERVNGIKQGYWSSATKEELIDRLAAFENLGRTPEELRRMLD